MAKVQMVIFEDANGNLFYSRAEKLEEQHKIENVFGLTKIAIIAGKESWQITSITDLKKSWERKHEELKELHDDIEREAGLHISIDAIGFQQDTNWNKGDVAEVQQSQHGYKGTTDINGVKISYDIFDLPDNGYIFEEDEVTVEHIAHMLNEGYVEGELNVCWYSAEYRGWWKKIDAILQPEKEILKRTVTIGGIDVEYEVQSLTQDDTEFVLFDYDSELLRISEMLLQGYTHGTFDVWYNGANRNGVWKKSEVQ